LVKIFTKIVDFDPKKGALKSWTARIVVNESLMLLRKRKAEFSQGEFHEELEIHDESETALERLSAKELTHLVMKLPDGYRTVFNMYVIEGYNHSEIAQILNISLGSSKSQLFKARKWLQARLEVMI